jgi:hypothetical protein
MRNEQIDIQQAESRHNADIRCSHAALGVQPLICIPDLLSLSTTASQHRVITPPKAAGSGTSRFQIYGCGMKLMSALDAFEIQAYRHHPYHWAVLLSLIVGGLFDWGA